MVGVPKSTGCVACRLQKKKCEVTSTPPCSRCMRLAIQCSGYGERRLKFQDETKKFTIRNCKSVTPGSSLSPRSLSDGGKGQCSIQTCVSISPIPTNALTVLAGSFVNCINTQGPSTSFSLINNFGSFLGDVPRHLGRNDSLDRVTDALATGFCRFRRVRCATYDPLCLNKYIGALRGLRRSLVTAETACEAETLCAIMMLMVVEVGPDSSPDKMPSCGKVYGITDIHPLQIFIDVPSSSLAHAGGAAQVLKCRGIRPPRSELERKLLFALRGPVVIQAFYLPLSYFSPAEWSALICAYCPAGPFAEEDSYFQPFARTVRLFQRTRKVILEDFADRMEIDDVGFRASLIHETLKAQAPSSEQLVRILNSGAQATAHLNNIYDFRGHGWMLMTTILVNCILAVACDASIEAENEQLCRKICDLAESHQARCSRPLGSLWLPLIIRIAYTGARAYEDQRRIIALLEDYASDLTGEMTSVKKADLEGLKTCLSFRDIMPDSSMKLK